MALSSLKKLTLGPPIKHPTPPKQEWKRGTGRWRAFVFPITFFLCSSWGSMPLPTLDRCGATSYSSALLFFALGDKVSLSGLELPLLCLSLLSGWGQATVTSTLKTRRVDDPRDATERPTSPLFILKDEEERRSHGYLNFRKDGHLPTNC